MPTEHMPCYIRVLPSQCPEIAFKCKACCGSPGLGNTLSSSTSWFFFQPGALSDWISSGFITFLPDFCSPGLWEPADREFLDTSYIARNLPIEPTHTWQKLKLTGTKWQISGFFFLCSFNYQKLPFYSFIPLYSFSTTFLSPGQVLGCAELQVSPLHRRWGRFFS